LQRKGEKIMKREGIKGVLGTYSTDPIDKVIEAVFYGCPVKVSGITPVRFGERDAIVVSFDVGDARLFPSILENYREHRERMELTMNIFLGKKKVNLDALK
jgi:hypothetical protein